MAAETVTERATICEETNKSLEMERRESKEGILENLELDTEEKAKEIQMLRNRKMVPKQ